MPTFYLDSFIGVKDGTKVPADRLDGRKVGAKRSTIFGSKPAGVAYAAADLIFAGTLRAGESLRNVIVNSDTSLGTTTLSLGPIGNATKYANARTMTVVDTPTSIGPRATAADDAPLTADEDLYFTLGVGGIGGAVAVTFEMQIASIK